MQETRKSAQKPKPNHTKKLGNKQFALYLKSQPRISTLIYNIQKYLSAYQPFYYNAFLSSIKGHDLDTLQLLLQQQYRKLTQHKSFLHKINNAVQSRQKCLQKIKRDLTKIESILTLFQKCYFRKSNPSDNIYLEYTQDQGYTTVEIDETIEHSIQLIKNLFVDMSRLRDMTVYVVETVHFWRLGVEEWMDRCQAHARVDFYVGRDDGNGGTTSVRLYDVILEDVDFIWSSRLSQYIWLQYKQDPLLIRNVLNISQRPKKQILQKYFLQILFPNSQQIIDKTIKVIDMFNHVYKPKQVNLYEEEQKLIQNYLGIQRKNNLEIGFEEQQGEEGDHVGGMGLKIGGSRIGKSHSESKISVKKQLRQQIVYDHKKWQDPTTAQSPYSTKSPGKANPRGWIFGKKLKKPSTQRIRQIIKKHEIEMNYLKTHKGIIKPFNISNYPQKKSIALAYLSQRNNDPVKAKQDGWIFSQDQVRRKRKNMGKDGKEGQQGKEGKGEKNFVSQGEENRFQSQVYVEREKQKLEASRKKMYQSLVKINTVIVQDPKQHENDHQTPKNRSTPKQPHQTQTNPKQKFYLLKNSTKPKQKTETQQQLSKTLDKKDTKKPTKQAQRKLEKSKDQKRENQMMRKTVGKGLAASGIKINSVFGDGNQGLELIQVQEEETPLNFRQFFEVFRADTRDKPKIQSRVVNQLTKSNLKNEQVKQLGGSIPIRKAIDRKRAQSLKSAALLPYYNQSKKPKKRPSKIAPNLNKSPNKSQSITNSQNSFQAYTKLPQPSPPPVPLPPTQHLSLHSKQITKDTITKYLLHLLSQLPITTQSFTNYHTPAYKSRMIQILEDSTVNSLIFQIQGEKDGKLGHAIVVESLGGGKMRYTVEFVHVGKLELLGLAVWRIAEELLSTTPCQEIVFKLVQDKADPVSTHFITLLDQTLQTHSSPSSSPTISILQKPLVSSLSHQSLYEHIYILQAKQKNLIKQQISQKYKNKYNWRKRMAGSSYRSLVVDALGLVLTSNFVMRSSQGLNKAVVKSYREESLGVLYVQLLERIMTKYHLKQLKIASLSLNDVDKTTGLVKKSPFLRSIFYNLLQLLRKSSNPPKKPLESSLTNSLTSYTNMTDLLNYLSYKQYDQVFKFDFLTESRFILNHQLILSQVNLSASLDFLLEGSTQMLLLGNYHGFAIQEIGRKRGKDTEKEDGGQDGVTGYMLPTTDDNLKLFFISAKQYLNCSDSLDLYSYLQLVFRQSTLKQRHDIEQIVIPDLTKRKTKITPVKMYDGFVRLFPERQFYSASMVKVQNLWENYYPNAVISRPQPGAVIIQYPLIMGFYDCALQMHVVSYLLRQEQ